MPSGNVAIEVRLAAGSRKHRSPIWQTWVRANSQPEDLESRSWLPADYHHPACL